MSVEGGAGVVVAEMDRATNQFLAGMAARGRTMGPEHLPPQERRRAHAPLSPGACHQGWHLGAAEPKMIADGATKLDPPSSLR